MLTEEVCDYLDIPVGKSVVKRCASLPPSLPPSPPILRSSSFLTLPPFLPPRFADGEVFIRILQEIRGRDCFVIIPTNSNDKSVTPLPPSLPPSPPPSLFFARISFL